VETRLTTRIGLALAGAGILAATTMAVPEAQRRNRGDNSIHGLPVATNTIVGAPERYFGKLVTVSAAVDEVLSKTLFVVDQRKAATGGEVTAVGAPLLVIAPNLLRMVERGRYFMVRGEVVKFSAGAIGSAAAGYTLDVAAEALAQYEGRPVLLATSIIDGSYAELTTAPTQTAKPAAAP
jgi:hypothetical protein